MHMKKKTYILTIIMIIFAVSACEKIEKPYLEPIGSQPAPPGGQVKKVLLEEYTGHKCPNCPEATIEAQTLKSIYGEQLILLSIHAGSLAEPDPSGAYTADFTTETGNTLFGVYSPGFVPCGTVNRSTPKAEFVGNWQGAIADILAQPQEANIKLESTFNQQSSILDITLEVEFLVDLTGTYNLCFYINESGIISPQLSNDGEIPDYEHEHMLRDSYGGAWGHQIASGTIAAGETVSETFQVNIGSELVPANTGIIAFVTDANDRRILQAEEKPIIE
jgi:hypothetical protein